MKMFIIYFFAPKVNCIYLGEPAVASDAPYYVRIYSELSEVKYCGGAILTRFWILTSAKCVLNSIFVDKGLLVISEGSKDKIIPVETYETHMNYSRKKNSYNIAMIKLKKPLEFGPMVQPVTLPVGDNREIKKGVIIGMGEIGSGDAKGKLMIGRNITIVRPKNGYPSHDEMSAFKACIDELIGNSKRTMSIEEFQKDFLCGGSDAMPCSGDDGGPLLDGLNVYPELIGIIPTRKPYSCRTSYSTWAPYTKVSNYYEWIHSIMDNSM